jgi:hypothetical protein
MPRYYFDMRENDGVAVDEQGMELPTVEAVQEEAIRSLADMAREAVRTGPVAGRHMAIEVRDDYGPVLQVKFEFNVDPTRH